MQPPDRKPNRPFSSPNEPDTLGRIVTWILALCITLILLGMTAVILTICYRFISGV